MTGTFFKVLGAVLMLTYITLGLFMLFSQGVRDYMGVKPMYANLYGGMLVLFGLYRGSRYLRKQSFYR